MNCEKAKELVLSGAEPGDEIQTHIASCAGCRNLASAWAALKDAKPAAAAEPSRNIDFKIRGAAAAYLDKGKVRHTVFVRRIFMYAAAACCVFVTWLSLDSIDRQSRTKGDSYRSSSSIPWGNIDMEKDFFELTTELELSILNIYSSGNSDNRNEKELEDFITDLST
ncbi:MAG: hypothetical protein WC637_05965 [Victivallales bacterium]|jgi:hypothetical protein